MRTLPPQWGKGRVGGVRAGGGDEALMGAAAQSRLSPQLIGYTPIQPSPIEGRLFHHARRFSVTAVAASLRGLTPPGP